MWFRRDEMIMKKLWSRITLGRVARYGLGLAMASTFTLGATNALADCRGDLEKYRMDSVLYEECAREALKNKDSELLYLVGLWNHYGIREKNFYKPASIELYRKFMTQAADLGNPDAQSMYIISESENATPDPKVQVYRQALAAQKDPQSKFRLIQLKQIEGNLTNADIDELEKLAAMPKNYEDTFFYAQLLASFADPARPETLAKPIELFEKLLSMPDTEKYAASIKGQTRWQLVRIYNSSPKAEVFSKAEKYLLELVQVGDLLAMSEYAKAYETSKYGTLSAPLAFAWRAQAATCARGTMSEDAFVKDFTEYSKNMTPTDLVAGVAYAFSLGSSFKCMHDNLIERKIDGNGKLVAEDSSEAKTQTTPKQTVQTSKEQDSKEQTSK